MVMYLELDMKMVGIEVMLVELLELHKIIGQEIGTVNDCYNRGDVSAVGEICGGIIGVVGDKVPGTWVEIVCCYNSGAITGVGSWGDIAGEFWWGDCKDCYWASSNGWTTGHWESGCGMSEGASFAGISCAKKVELLGSAFIETTGDSLPILAWESNI